MLKVFILLIIIFQSNNLYAAVIMETWTAEVRTLTNNNIYSFYSNVSFNGYNIGDTITWNVSYNSEPGNYFTRFLDGVNGISEKGQGDDILHTLSCLDKNFSPDCGNSLGDDSFTSLFNSKSNIDSIYNTLAGELGNDEVVYDYFNFNNDTRSYRSQPYRNFTQYDYYADEFNLYADNRQFPIGGAGYAQLFYEKTNGEIWVSRIGFSNIKIITTSIPEPSMITLMGLGLIIIFGARRRAGSPKCTKLSNNNFS